MFLFCFFKKKKWRKGLLVFNSLRGHRDSQGGPKHEEKKGLRGSRQTYWEMTKNIWDHSQTQAHAEDIHALYERHTAIKVILKLPSNPDASWCKTHLCKVWGCVEFVICRESGKDMRHEAARFVWPQWLDEQQCWVGLKGPTHIPAHIYPYMSLVSSSVTSIIPVSILQYFLHWWIELMIKLRYFEWEKAFLLFLRNLLVRESLVISNCFFLCVSTRSHGLHGAWQRTARGSYGEKNGPTKSCERRSGSKTRLEEKAHTAPSFPQGAHAVLEQGEQKASDLHGVFRKIIHLLWTC